jgi:hypothetical protein
MISPPAERNAFPPDATEYATTADDGALPYIRLSPSVPPSLASSLSLPGHCS